MTCKIESANVPPASQIDQELALLETLQVLLSEAIHALGGGEAGSLLEMSNRIRDAADELTRLAINLGRLPASSEAQRERRRLLTELGQQRSFCRAMLRRWRRSLVLRQHLLGLQSEAAPYTESFESHAY